MPLYKPNKGASIKNKALKGVDEEMFNQASKMVKEDFKRKDKNKRNDKEFFMNVQNELVD